MLRSEKVYAFIDEKGKNNIIPSKQTQTHLSKLGLNIFLLFGLSFRADYRTNTWHLANASVDRLLFTIWNIIAAAAWKWFNVWHFSSSLSTAAAAWYKNNTNFSDVKEKSRVKTCFIFKHYSLHSATATNWSK